MASTNEDIVVLATAPLGETGLLLVKRHLPDRGTVELGWREASGGAVVPRPSVLELAAEAVELDAVARLYELILRTDMEWGTSGEGEVLAETPPFADGARVAAVRAGEGLRLVRQPEGVDLPLPSQAALAQLAVLFPAAQRKLEDLGSGLVQQGDQAFPDIDERHARGCDRPRPSVQDQRRPNPVLSASIAVRPGLAGGAPAAHVPAQKKGRAQGPAN